MGTQRLLTTPTRSSAALTATAKKTGGVRRFIHWLFGPATARALVARSLRKKIDTTPTTFPADLSRSSEIMFVLPKDRHELVYQLETIFAIVEKYKESTFTFVCPKPYGPLFENIDNSYVVEFNSEEFTEIYGLEHSRVVHVAAFNAMDICVMLERQYTLSHLYLVGSCRAHLRVGWGDADTSPFLNVRLVESEEEDANLPARNFEAAKILNAPPAQNGFANICRTFAADEINAELNKVGLKSGKPLICFDVQELVANYGDMFCKDLVAAFRKSDGGAWQYCAFGGFDGDAPVAINSLPIPMLDAMPLQNAAALLARVSLVVCGGGSFLGLSQAALKKVVPVLTHGDAMRYCKKSPRVLPVTFSEKPNSETIRDALKNVRTLLSNNSNSNNVNSNVNNGANNNRNNNTNNNVNDKNVNASVNINTGNNS